MSDVSIKVTIAGRSYPLTVSAEDEAGIRIAEQQLQESIDIFQTNYAVKDKQDLLAMAALQVATKKQPQPEVQRVVETIVEVKEIPVENTDFLIQLEQQLDGYLNA